MTRRRPVWAFLNLLALAVYLPPVVAAPTAIELVENTTLSYYDLKNYVISVEWSLWPIGARAAQLTTAELMFPKGVDVFLEHRLFDFRNGLPCNSNLTGGGSISSSSSHFCATLSTDLPLKHGFQVENLQSYLGPEYHFRFMWEDTDEDEDENEKAAVTPTVAYANIPIATFIRGLKNWNIVRTEEERQMAEKGFVRRVSRFI